MSNFILSPSGIHIDPENPTPDKIDLYDIAVGLCREKRFRGYTKVPYNVAQHSCMVAEIVTKMHFDDARQVSKNACAAALLHDASEAYIGDIIQPLKAVLPDYRRIEKLWMDAIAARFAINHFDLPCIDLADHWCFKVEVSRLCANPGDYGFSPEDLINEQADRFCQAYPALNQIAVPWDKDSACANFLGMAHELL